jgi:acetyltransferase-like isoleucine patch superfamily enzyme
MRKVINATIKKLKGGDYNVDRRIPMSYLAGLAFSRLIMAARGGLSRIKHKGFLFIAGGVTIKARSMFRVGRTVSIGKRCYIDALSTDGVVFGDNVSMGKYVRIECTGNLQKIGKGISVGNNVGLGADNFFGCAGGITIGDDTIMGNFISFHSENHLFDNKEIPIRLQGISHKGILIGNDCWIGSKATVLDGAIVENGCIIAAGSVVPAGQYKSNGIYGGIPATLIRHRGNDREKEYKELFEVPGHNL